MHLYMGSNVEKTVNGKTVNVQMESDMPWEGNIKIRVQAENAKMTLALRIPGWCKNYKISGIEDAAQEEKDGYLYLKKVWNREETFCIDFPMEVQMFAASERVREDIGKAAIMRGPVVYCLEEKDNGKNLHELLIDTDMHASVSEGKICDTVVKMVETDGWRLTESGDARGDSLSHVSKAAEAKGAFALYSVLHMGKPRRKRNAGMDTRAEPLRVLQLIAVLRWRDMVIGSECLAEIVVIGIA